MQAMSAYPECGMRNMECGNERKPYWIQLRYFNRLLFALIASLGIWSCTSNPFFDDKVEITQHLSVEGTVLLSDNIIPDQIYVWMEGIGLSTATDQQGRFKIELPSPKLQPGGGLNGIYNIYYFLGNYQLASSSTLLLNGQFELGNGAINSEGKIGKTIVLQKLLDIHTEVSPANIESNYKDSLVIKILLNNRVDSVRVLTYKHMFFGNTSCVIIKPTGQPDSTAILLRGTPTILAEEVIKNYTEWMMIYKFSPFFFEAGQYDFIPYLEIVQNLPDQLLKSLNNEGYDFNVSYLKIPFKRSDGRLTVSALKPN